MVFFIKHNIHAVEWKKNAMNNKNKKLINKLDRSKCHPLIRKFSQVPFSIYYMYVTNITDECDKNYR